MAKAIGTFINNHYFPIAVPMLNSLFYNGVEARIKVYDNCGLNHLLKNYLRKYVDVIDLPDPSAINPTWMHGCKFRPIMLTQTGFEDAELFLDADMVVLSDLRWPLRSIESGMFVCSREWSWGPGDIDETVTKRWKILVGVPPPKEFGVYNGGLLGFNLSKHYDLIQKWADVCCDRSIYKKQPFNNDQMVISGLIESLNMPKKILPKRYWMTTWEIHGKPPKLLGFNEQGLIRLYDSETGKPIQIYHYTGGIGQEISGKPTTMRYYHAHGEAILDHPELYQEQMVAWKNLWECHYRSAAGLLADFMRDAGPLAVPKTFSMPFRKQVVNLLGELCCDVISTDDRRVHAICLAYDYIDLLGYRLGGRSWLEKPLHALLGPKIYQGTKVLSWGDSADVTLSFGPTSNTCPWTAGRYADPGSVEHLGGVNLLTN